MYFNTNVFFIWSIFKQKNSFFWNNSIWFALQFLKYVLSTLLSESMNLIKHYANLPKWQVFTARGKFKKTLPRVSIQVTSLHKISESSISIFQYLRNHSWCKRYLGYLTNSSVENYFFNISVFIPSPYLSIPIHLRMVIKQEKRDAKPLYSVMLIFLQAYRMFFTDVSGLDLNYSKNWANCQPKFFLCITSSQLCPIGLP